MRGVEQGNPVRWTGQVCPKDVPGLCGEQGRLVQRYTPVTLRSETTGQVKKITGQIKKTTSRIKKNVLLFLLKDSIVLKDPILFLKRSLVLNDRTFERLVTCQFTH